VAKKAPDTQKGIKELQEKISTTSSAFFKSKYQKELVQKEEQLKGLKDEFNTLLIIMDLKDLHINLESQKKRKQEINR